MRLPRLRPLVLLTLVFTLCLPLMACAPTTKVIAAGVEGGAEIARSEFSAAVERGELSAEDGHRLDLFAREVGSSAHSAQLTAVSWPALSPEQKRAAVLNFVSDLVAANDRLDAAGAPVFKSERARKKFAQFRLDLHRAEIGLRVIEAALPDGNSQPAPPQRN